MVYSDECHPVGNPDWWHYKRRHFGGDDGIEFLDAERLIPLFDRNTRCTHLRVQLTETDVSLSLITRTWPTLCNPGQRRAGQVLIRNRGVNIG